MINLFDEMKRWINVADLPDKLSPHEVLTTELITRISDQDQGDTQAAKVPEFFLSESSPFWREFVTAEEGPKREDAWAAIKSLEVLEPTRRAQVGGVMSHQSTKGEKSGFIVPIHGELYELSKHTKTAGDHDSASESSSGRGEDRVLVIFDQLSQWKPGDRENLRDAIYAGFCEAGGALSPHQYLVVYGVVDEAHLPLPQISTTTSFGASCLMVGYLLAHPLERTDYSHIICTGAYHSNVGTINYELQKVAEVDAKAIGVKRFKEEPNRDRRETPVQFLIAEGSHGVGEINVEISFKEVKAIQELVDEFGLQRPSIRYEAAVTRSAQEPLSDESWDLRYHLTRYDRDRELTDLNFDEVAADSHLIVDFDGAGKTSYLEAFYHDRVKRWQEHDLSQATRIPVWLDVQMFVDDLFATSNPETLEIQTLLDRLSDHLLRVTGLPPTLIKLDRLIILFDTSKGWDDISEDQIINTQRRFFTLISHLKSSMRCLIATRREGFNVLRSCGLSLCEIVPLNRDEVRSRLQGHLTPELEAWVYQEEGGSLLGHRGLCAQAVSALEVASLSPDELLTRVSNRGVNLFKGYVKERYPNVIDETLELFLGELALSLLGNHANHCDELSFREWMSSRPRSPQRDEVVHHWVALTHHSGLLCAQYLELGVFPVYQFRHLSLQLNYAARYLLRRRTSESQESSLDQLLPELFGEEWEAHPHVNTLKSICDRLGHDYDETRA